MSKRTLIPCSVFGGRTAAGFPVGSRHKWPFGWGKGRCQFCGRTLDEVTKKVERQGDAAHLARALKSGE